MTNLPINKIVCSDNVKEMKTFPDDCIDLVVTSPPQWDFEGVSSELARVLKPGGVIVWVVADATINGSETGTSFRQALSFMELGLNLHDTMIWSKGRFSDVGSTFVRYGPSTEYMFVFSKGKPNCFNPIKDRRNAKEGRGATGTLRQKDGGFKPVTKTVKKLGEYGIRFNVWDIYTTQGHKGHPASFPDNLAADHIISWSNEGNIVLDPFSGSGTTAKMAKVNGRKYIGIEINQDYCNIAEQRLSQGVFDF